MFNENGVASQFYFQQNMYTSNTAAPTKQGFAGAGKVAHAKNASEQGHKYKIGASDEVIM